MDKQDSNELDFCPVSVPLTQHQAAFLDIVAKHSDLPGKRMEDLFLLWAGDCIRDILLDPHAAMEMGIALTDWPDLLQEISPISRQAILDRWSGRHGGYRRLRGKNLTAGLPGEPEGTLSRKAQIT